MIVVAGGDLILPDRVVTEGSLVIESGRIAAIESGRIAPAGAEIVDAGDCYVVPGFLDVHMHGLHGHDALDGSGSVARIAALLPQYGVTAFCPTTVACSPDDLRHVLQQVRQARVSPVAGSARVLPAHLESNFINPEYRGAQPSSCLRSPGPDDRPLEGSFSGRDVLGVIGAHKPDVGIVTLAPELPGALDLIRTLVGGGHRISLGHSGADLETAMAAIDAGARHATHLFNRMTPMSHRAPGIAGAVLARDEVAVEIICDMHHVHPAMCQVALAAKSCHKVMAITDSTAGAGLPVGAEARLGGRVIRVRDEAAVLGDGTLAGSTLTMDRAFRNVVTRLGASLVDAAIMCATTPARELGLTGFGVLADGAVADLAVLDRGFGVVQTFIAGESVWRRQAANHRRARPV
jgi:N-acetylglucosamine-6-phosphate deacetylase